MNKYNYVIIGNGIAGLSAAEEIRKNDEKSSVLIISREGYLTYMRPKLSHLLSKEVNTESLLVKNIEWYDSNSITRMLNKEVKNVNFKEKKIYTETEDDVFCYDKLLITSGSRPFLPSIEGMNSDNSASLRNIEDLLKINEIMRGKEHVTVIGGGVLGIEAAVSFSDSGKKVSIVEFAPHLLSRQLDRDSSYIIEDLLKKRGISIHKGVAVNKIEENNQKLLLTLSDGTFSETGFVLVSAGIIPEIDFVRNSELKINRGILVDSNMKTSVDSVFAAGDSAEFEGRVIGLWKPSSDMGKCAGKNMVVPGSAEFLTEAPPTMMNIDGTKVFSIGKFDLDNQIISSTEDTSSFFKIFTENNMINGVILIGDTSKMSIFKNLVEKKVKIDKELLLGNPKEIFENLSFKK